MIVGFFREIVSFDSYFVRQRIIEKDNGWKLGNPWHSGNPTLFPSVRISNLTKSLQVFFCEICENFPSVRIFVFRETAEFLFTLQAQQFAHDLLQKVLNTILLHLDSIPGPIIYFLKSHV